MPDDPTMDVPPIAEFIPPATPAPPSQSRRAVREGTLAQDPLVRIALVFLALLSLPYLIPIFPKGWLQTYGANYIDLPLLTLIIVATRLRLRGFTDQDERRFWNWLGLAFSFWLGLGLTNSVIALFPLSGVVVDTYNMLLYFCVYVSTAMALESRPHLKGERWSRRLRAFNQVAAFVFLFGLLLYFSLLPGLIHSRTYWAPSLSLFVVFDVYFVFRLFGLRHTATKPGWRSVYSWLLLASFFWLLCDGTEQLVWTGAVPYIDTDSIWNLVWILSFPVVVIATRAADYQPGGDDPPPSRDHARIGPVIVYAMAVPVLHLFLYRMGWAELALRPSRDVLVLLFTLVLAGMAFAYQEVLRAEYSRLAEERARVDEKLVQAQKLAAVGQLGTGIAHELNQPLSAILMFAEQIQKEPERKVSDFSKELTLISEQTQRMGRIVNDIRDFTKVRTAGLRATDPLEPLDKALSLLEDLFRVAGVELIRRPDEGLPSIWADSARLQQVFLNLLTNSLNAFETIPQQVGKRVYLGARTTRGFVEYTVEDNGPGVPEAHESMIFNPFFTTGDIGKGTGLGLFVAYGIAKEHGGELRYESLPSGGARFLFEVPMAAYAREMPSASGVTADEIQAKTGCVLAVDDEKVVRTVLKSTLERNGWEVTTATSGEEALASLEDARFDLLLLDLKMPGLGGLGTASLVRKKWPQMPVVVMSGFVTQEESELLQDLGVVQVLQKPTPMAELMEALTRALETAREGDV